MLLCFEKLISTLDLFLGGLEKNNSLLKTTDPPLSRNAMKIALTHLDFLTIRNDNCFAPEMWESSKEGMLLYSKQDRCISMKYWLLLLQAKASLKKATYSNHALE